MKSVIKSNNHDGGEEFRPSRRFAGRSDERVLRAGSWRRPDGRNGRDSGRPSSSPWSWSRLISAIQRWRWLPHASS